MARLLEHKQADDGTIFDVLARQARGRNPYALAMTTLVGAADASFIWWQYHGLHWLAAGFMAVAMYGVWGVADYIIGDDIGLEPPFSGRRSFFGLVRFLAVPVGIVAAMLAVGGFMAAALGGWNH